MTSCSRLLLFSHVSVHRMRDEFEAVLSRMSHEFPDSPRRIAFLINNYDLIVSVFQVSFFFFFDLVAIGWIILIIFTF